MLELLQHRRSIRTFTDEPVSQENIDSLLKAALLAPSSMGKKPVECIVVRNKETIARLKTYKKHGTTPLGTAPLAAVAFAPPKLDPCGTEPEFLRLKLDEDGYDGGVLHPYVGFLAGAWHP